MILYFLLHVKFGDFVLARRVHDLSSTGLSENERRLLSALVHFPEATDKRLGEIASLEPQAVTYLRTRLHKRGVFRYMRIPTFGRLGAELFSASILTLNPQIERRASMESLRQALGAMPGIFWAFGDGHQAVVLGIYGSRNEMEADLARLASIPTVAGKESVAMPMSSFDGANFLEFRPVVSGLTNIPTSGTPASPGVEPACASGPAQGPATASGRFRPLLGFEKEAFQALVDNPEEGASALARRLGITRSAFLHRTEEIMREGLYRTVVVPDIRLIGLEALAIWSAGGGEIGAGETGAGEVVTTPVGRVSTPPEPGSLDVPVQNIETGEISPQAPEPALESAPILPERIPALKEDCAPEALKRAGGGDESPFPLAGDLVKVEEEASAIASGPAITEKRPEEAGGRPPDPDDGKMPWQSFPLAPPARSGFEAAPRWDSRESRGTRGIEALPKDLRGMLIGRPSNEAVEKVKAELWRRHIRDIDLDQILQDAGVLPVKQSIQVPVKSLSVTADPGIGPKPPEVAVADSAGKERAHIHEARNDLVGVPKAVSIAVSDVPTDLPRRRGRPPKNAGVPVPVPDPIPRRRGRPPKNEGLMAPVAEPVPRRRGRPPKNVGILAPNPGPVPRRHGRPPKNAGTPAPVAGPGIRRRGRLPKSTRISAPVPGPFPQAMAAMVVPGIKTGEPLPVMRRKRGRPRKNPVDAGPPPEGFIDTSLGRLPKEVISLLTGRPSKTAINHAKAELARLGHDIDLDRLFVDADRKKKAVSDPTSSSRPVEEPVPDNRKVKTRYNAMVMKEFVLRPERTNSGGRKTDGGPPEGDGAMVGNGSRDNPAAGTNNFPLFLDVRGDGRRFILGLFPDRNSALRADEQLRREFGTGIRFQLMPIQHMEILKEMDFAPIVRKLLEMD
jgi:hypothetical protein